MISPRASLSETIRVLASACAVWSLLAHPAAAESNGDMGLMIGAKIGPGANLVTTPGNTNPNASLPFDDGAGGWGMGGGPFGEIRFLNGHLSAELGLMFDYSKNWSQITFNQVLETEWGFSTFDLRIPLLLKAGSSDDGTRFIFGIGPEFVIPLSASPSFDITEGRQFLAPGEEQNLKDNFTATDPGAHVNLAVEIGTAIPLSDIWLTIALRFSLNLGVPSDYADRVTTGTPANPQFEVEAQHNVDARILFGLAYDLSLGS